MHDTLQTGLPLALILVGILMNRHDVKDLRREMLDRFDRVDHRFDGLRAEMDTRFNTLRAEMDRRFDSVDAELRYFHDTTGKLTGRVDELSRRVQ